MKEVDSRERGYYQITGRTVKQQLYMVKSEAERKRFVHVLQHKDQRHGGNQGL